MADVLLAPTRVLVVSGTDYDTRNRKLTKDLIDESDKGAIAQLIGAFAPDVHALVSP